MATPELQSAFESLVGSLTAVFQKTHKILVVHAALLPDCEIFLSDPVCGSPSWHAAASSEPTVVFMNLLDVDCERAAAIKENLMPETEENKDLKSFKWKCTSANFYLPTFSTLVFFDENDWEETEGAEKS